MLLVGQLQCSGDARPLDPNLRIQRDTLRIEDVMKAVFLDYRETADGQEAIFSTPDEDLFINYGEVDCRYSTRAQFGAADVSRKNELVTLFFLKPVHSDCKVFRQSTLILRFKKGGDGWRVVARDISYEASNWSSRRAQSISLGNGTTGFLIHRETGLMGNTHIHSEIIAPVSEEYQRVFAALFSVYSGRHPGGVQPAECVPEQFCYSSDFTVSIQDCTATFCPLVVRNREGRILDTLSFQNGKYKRKNEDAKSDMEE